MKKKLNKCKTIFHAYNEFQFKYGNLLDEKDNVSEFKCNVRINCSLGDNYTTDFYIINKDGSITIREDCRIYRNKTAHKDIVEKETVEEAKAIILDTVKLINKAYTYFPTILAKKE